MIHIKNIAKSAVATLLTLLLNPEWSIPAWILLALHFWLDISVWWFIGGLAFWMLCVFAGMRFLGWAADCGRQKDPPKENKNPYSVKHGRAKEKPFMLDGPDMEYRSPWTSFTLSVTDSSTQYSFLFTVTETEAEAVVTGFCRDENGADCEAETGVPISVQDLWKLRWMNLEQLPDEKPWPEDPERPADMTGRMLMLTRSDGTIEKKNASGDLSIEIYKLLLPYLKNN